MSITLEQAQEFLRITSSDKDEFLEILLTATKQIIEDFTGLDLTYSPNTIKKFDGTDTDFIKLPFPASNLISVSVDGVSIATSNLRIKNGFLETTDGVSTFAAGRDNVSVIATWGNSTWNSDLLVAQRMLLAWLYDKDKDTVAVSGKSYKDFVVDYLQDIPQPIVTILQSYKVSAL